MLFLRLAAVPAKRLYSNAAAAMGDSAKIADLSITTAPNGPVSLHYIINIIHYPTYFLFARLNGLNFLP